jgi:hypothetical protein
MSKDYICDQCGCHIVDGDHVILETHPDLYNHPLRELVISMDAKSSNLHKQGFFHKKVVFTPRISREVICGPLHEETQQEYYVRMAGGIRTIKTS